MSDEEIRKHCNSYGYSDGEVYAYKDGYQQGRADAIDEFMHFLNKNSETVTPNGWNSKIEIICMSVVREIAKQLKEQN